MEVLRDAVHTGSIEICAIWLHQHRSGPDATSRGRASGLNDVGSYGRQLGRIGDALEVLLNHVKLDGLSQAEKDALSILRGQLAAVRQVKERTLTSVNASA